MDRRTIIAIVLSALILILMPLAFERLGWVPKRTPPVATAPDTLAAPPATSPPAPAQSAADTASPLPSTSSMGAPVAAASDRPGREIRLENADMVAVFDSRGARLRRVHLPHYETPADTAVILGDSPLVEIDLGSDPRASALATYVYEVAESADTSGRTQAVRFALADTSGVRVVQTYRLSPDGYTIDLDLQMDGVLARGYADYRVTLHSWPLVTERNVTEDVNNLQTVAMIGNEVRRSRFKDLRAPKPIEGAIRWVAVRSKYFAAAAIPQGASTKGALAYVPDPVPGEARPEGAPSQQVAATLTLPVPPPGTTHHLRLYTGPNDYWRLTKVGGDLQDIVDLGWRWLLPFSRAILKVMVFMQQFVPNYGLVIILLSALVKLVFHPLTASSMRSMRAMQKIQPEIKRLQERYKKDPTKLNQAVMEMYKQNKVNPVGGCLPMVIQMPVLFALYQVFLHALELRQAPFVAWINDLSAPDLLFSVAGFPIRVLPLIMYGSAWLQQKMTPSDPQQVMTLQLMNVFLLVIFYNLPSGLVLYWTVTNLLTALQQYWINRGDQPLVVKAA